MTLPTHRDTLDDHIDRVASQLTKSEPPAHLRDRILSRLDERQPRVVGGWTLAAAAAIAIVVIGTAISMWPHASTSQAVSVTAQLHGAPPATAPAHTPDITPATTTIDLQHPVAHTNPAPTFVSSVPALDPIDPLDSITQESIQPTKLSIAQLKVNAIVMPAVDDDGSTRE
jgi:hypothetical protein